MRLARNEKPFARHHPDRMGSRAKGSFHDIMAHRAALNRMAERYNPTSPMNFRTVVAASPSSKVTLSLGWYSGLSTPAYPGLVS